jgi:hypothetical protein
MAFSMQLVDSRLVQRRRYQMTIVAQDPSVKDADGRILVAQVGVPADRLEPGPRSHRFHVVDYDAGKGELQPPAVLTEPTPFGDPNRGWMYVDRFADADNAALLSDPVFHAQNVYAIAARTLGAFEFALGRRVKWGFGSHQLYLVPHAFAEANAFYAEEDDALFFGYLPLDELSTVYACLSHDVIAHETTHALLDGLRPRYTEPGLPEQPAFHEALADVVALLSVFSVQEVVERLLGEPDAEGRIDASEVSVDGLAASALFGLAEELGEAVAGERGSALRRSVKLEPSAPWRTDPAFEEPHRLGEVLVAAVMQTLRQMWAERLTRLIHAGRIDRARAAEEGSKAATHLLTMAIRAIDYTPPAEFEFEDFVDAVFVSDSVVAPDDEHQYRDKLLDSFGAFGITRPAEEIVDLSKQGPLQYENVNFTALRGAADEVYRFLWQNADLLGIDRAYHLQVESIHPSVRVGPDGLVVQETAADYIQMLGATAGELATLGVEAPAGLDPATEVQILGGGTVIFDQFGAAKFHQTKPLQDWKRQSRRLDYLVRTRQHDSDGRFGFSLGTSRGQLFAEFHLADARAEEAW